MAQLIKPLLTGKPFESTTHRLLTMFQPIQKTKTKESDFVAFIATPVLDYTVLDVLFALDASIRLLNATASLLKAAYLWTLNQQSSSDLLDEETAEEFDSFISNAESIISSIVAQFMNLTLSTASLVTRPVVSIIEACCDDDSEETLHNYNPCH